MSGLNLTMMLVMVASTISSATGFLVCAAVHGPVRRSNIPPPPLDVQEMGASVTFLCQPPTPLSLSLSLSLPSALRSGAIRVGVGMPRRLNSPASPLHFMPARATKSGFIDEHL